MMRMNKISFDGAKRAMSSSNISRVSGSKSIKIPEMIRLSEKLSIMKREVTVGLFKQVMKGYNVIGNNADGLKAILDDPSRTEDTLHYVSLNDAREFAVRLSKQTGRKFRVQRNMEWLQSKKYISGTGWTWTETKDGVAFHILRSLDMTDEFNSSLPKERDYNYAIRLVEDLA